MTENKYKKVEEVIAHRAKLTRVSSASGYKGVSRDNSTSSSYRSVFTLSTSNNKVKISLGNYATPEEAYIARIKFIDSLK